VGKALDRAVEEVEDDGEGEGDRVTRGGGRWWRGPAAAAAAAGGGATSRWLGTLAGAGECAMPAAQRYI
jgi:hypothetical protein